MPCTTIYGSDGHTTRKSAIWPDGSGGHTTRKSAMEVMGILLEIHYSLVHVIILHVIT